MSITEHNATPETLQECTRRILDELTMAIDWQRPSIILIVYRSEFVRAHLQATLEQAISDLKQKVSQIYVDNKQFDIPLILREEPQRGNAVFFVAGLQWGGGRGRKNAYRALNLHREYLVDYQIRTIFWLTPKEAASLPRYAPDFWAFRHRVFEFLDLPFSGDAPICAQDILVGKWQSIIGTPHVKRKIALYKRMLTDLSSRSTSLQLQAEIHARIGALSWVDREYSQAKQHLETCLGIAKKLNDRGLQAECLDGLGILHQSMRHHKKAVMLYKKAISINPEDELAWSNLASAYQAMESFNEAMSAAEQATKCSPKTPETWLIQGNIYFNLGFYEDAVVAYKRAARLNPAEIRAQIYLGEIHSRWKHPRLATRYFSNAEQIRIGNMVSGNAEKYR